MLTRRRLGRVHRRLRGFTRDRRGVSAVEFALIAPILLLMFVGMAALSSALMGQRRANHATTSVGDLVAQFATVIPSSDLPNAFGAASDIMAPFQSTTLQLRVSSLIVDGLLVPTARVNWSCATTNNSSPYLAYQAGTPSTAFNPNPLPTGLVTNTGDSIIMVESTYTYTPPASGVIPASLTFRNVAFFKPRQSAFVGLNFPITQLPPYSATPWVGLSLSIPYNYNSGSSTVPSLNCYYQSG